MTVVDGQSTNVNFGVKALPDLTSISFQLAAPATIWGQPITIDYTLTNQGAGDAGPFAVGVYLSDNGTISTTGTLLDTLQFADGLAAGTCRSAGR